MSVERGEVGVGQRACDAANTRRQKGAGGYLEVDPPKSCVCKRWRERRRESGWAVRQAREAERVNKDPKVGVRYMPWARRPILFFGDVVMLLIAGAKVSHTAPALFLG